MFILMLIVLINVKDSSQSLNMPVYATGFPLKNVFASNLMLTSKAVLWWSTCWISTVTKQQITLLFSILYIVIKNKLQPLFQNTEVWHFWVLTCAKTFFFLFHVKVWNKQSFQQLALHFGFGSYDKNCISYHCGFSVVVGKTDKTVFRKGQA